MLRRTLRLWGLYAWLDVMFVARGAGPTLTYFVSDAIVAIASVSATFLIAERFGGIGPWSRDQVLFMLGYATLTRGLIDIFFSYNVGFISRRIGRGQLDHSLVQPQPLWMILLTEGFIPFSGLSTLWPGVALTIWALTQLDLAVAPAWLALFGLNVLGSAAIVLAFNYAIGSLAFWAPRAAEEVNSSSWRLFQALAQFPLDGVGPLLRGGLVTLLPIGFAAWYPSRALLGIDDTPGAVLVTPLAAVVFGVVCAWIFRKGLDQYGRTGSARYLSWGHRR